MVKRTGIAAAALALTLAGAAELGARQQSVDAGAGVLVERVVAIVGDSVILWNDIEEHRIQLEQSGRAMPADSAGRQQIRREILEGLVTDLLLLQAALADSITISDEEVRAAVDAEIAQIQRNFGGSAAFEQALRSELGMTPDQYRDMLAREYRRSALSQQYLQRVTQQRRPPPVSDAEVEAFFEEFRGQLGQRPATISFRQIAVLPQPSDSARARARQRAEEVLEMARSGEDFAVLARRFSDDPGSREQGGDLGWHRHGGGLVAPFEDALFSPSFRVGMISDIVETSFGYHIIKLERVRGAERQARHILIRPELTPEDIDRTATRAEEATARLRAGEPIDSLIPIYHHPDQETDANDVVIDRLPPEYASALASARPGEIIGPIRMGSGDQTMYAIIQVTAYRPPGEYTLADLSSEIRQRLEQQKLVEELVEELRRKTYVDIRL